MATPSNVRAEALKDLGNQFKLLDCSDLLQKHWGSMYFVSRLRRDVCRSIAHGLLLFAVFVAMSSASGQQSARFQMANRLLDALQFDSSLERFGNRQYPGALASDSAALERFRDFRSKYLDVARMRQLAATRYSELFSADELSELMGFFESTAGKKYVELQPQIGDSIQPIIAAAFREHAEEFRRDVLRLP